MVTYYLAYTAPINPPNTTPVLTVPQVWQGLQRKIRFAQEFVSAITSCTVLEDKDGVVTRAVTFKEGLGVATNVKEVVKSYEPTWVSLTSLFLARRESRSKSRLILLHARWCWADNVEGFGTVSVCGLASLRVGLN